MRCVNLQGTPIKSGRIKCESNNSGAVETLMIIDDPRIDIGTSSNHICINELQTKC